MNLFIREMKANRKALIIWSVCMFLLVLSGMSKYTAYSSGGTTADIFAKMPYTLRALLGISSLEVTKMNGFYAFLFPYLEITAAIHAVLLGSTIIAKEERDKTTEFIAVKPISRFSMITSKLTAAIINVIIFNLVTLVSSVLSVSAFNKGADVTKEIIVFDVCMLFVQLIYLSIGAFLAACLRKPKGAGSIGAGILLVGYAIAKVTDINDKLSFLNVISPFKYYNISDIANGSGLSILISILVLLVTMLFFAGTYYFYMRRDLNI